MPTLATGANFAIANYGYQTGCIVFGEDRADLQKNARVSLTGSVPLGRRQSLKLFWAKGATTSIGPERGQV